MRDRFTREMFLTSEDTSKYVGSLTKLARHLRNPVIVTGSIASSLYLLRKGVPRNKIYLNDIDTVVENLSDVHATLSQDFLINHFHPTREKGKVFLQLVDEEYATRLEIFIANSKTLSQRLTNFFIGDLAFKAVSAEDLLAKLLSIIYSVTESKMVAPKYVEHFRLLLQWADLPAAQEIWQDYRRENQAADFDEACQIVEQSIAAHPNFLQAEEYCQNINFECHWCIQSKIFPLAPRIKIYDILSYV